MRVGVVVLPDQRWSEQRSKWVALDQMGFDHAWTYDHLAWRSLADGPWFATIPTLAAAAGVTDRIRLGTMVASPNYRHPVPFAKELMTLDDLSSGRIIAGIGAGGTGVDARVLGTAALDGRQRYQRFDDFVRGLDQLLREPVTSFTREYYTAIDARMIPGCVQRPRLPLAIAANGPRAMRLAAQLGQGWVTIGPTEPDVSESKWWRHLATLVTRFDEVSADVGADARVTTNPARYLQPESTGMAATTSVDRFADVAGRAGELGFTDLVVHWPRSKGVYAGDERVLSAIATDVLPGLAS